MSFCLYGCNKVASVLYYELIGNKRNELSVSGLIVLSVYVEAKELVDVLYLTPCPAYLDGMAYCAFHLAWRRIESLGNARVQLLGDLAHEVGIVVNHADRFTQVMIALDMRRDPYGQEDGGYLLVKALHAGALMHCHLLVGNAVLQQVLHALVQKFRLDGLQHDIAWRMPFGAGCRCACMMRR